MPYNLSFTKKKIDKKKKERERRKKSHPGNELFMTDIKFKKGKEDSHLKYVIFVEVIHFSFLKTIFMK